MGNPAGVKRDFDQLEQRRMEAAQLLKSGLSEAEVARRVGVHRQSVNRWGRQLVESGRKGLRQAGRAGRKPRLTAPDLKRIEKGLQRGPQALGYESNMWTAARVGDLIEQECGIKYHEGHVWRILQQMGWSCQRPTGRAIERDEEAVQQWKKKRWPAIKKKPVNRAGRSSSSTKAD
jgi:transposase